MLRLDHVWRTYQVGDAEVVALRDVTLTIADADFMSIAGPSGSGKSTLLQILGLLDRPTSGSVLLNGVDLADLSDEDRSRLRLHTLGFVFQRFHLLNDLTALENVALPMEAAGVSTGKRYRRAAELLAAMGLSDRLDFRPSRLSGGQRQRVAIARALANDPEIILADEPTGELHTEDRAAVVEIFRQLHRQGRAVVIVTHDPEVAAVTERKIEIRDGRVSDETAQSQPPVGLMTTYTPPSQIVPRGGAEKRHSGGRKRWLAVLGLIAMLLGGIAVFRATQLPLQSGTPAVPTASTTAPRTARGEVRPEQEARLRSFAPGVVSTLLVSSGNQVNDGQELARIRAADGSIELITAPWRGTVTGVPIHVGDSVTAGALLMTVGDLSRLHIETTDVDEFLIPRIQQGLAVKIALDALPSYELTGVVSEVSLLSETTPEGDQHYPVKVRFDWTPSEVRPGMTARIRLPD
jgi:putative ABC transport system ATP-binding protein